jgi:hypothetical protein
MHIETQGQGCEGEKAPVPMMCSCAVMSLKLDGLYFSTHGTSVSRAEAAGLASAACFPLIY